MSRYVLCLLVLSACDEDAPSSDTPAPDVSDTQVDPGDQESSDDTNETGPDTSEEEEEEELFQPVAGDWVVQESTLLSDDCSLSEEVNRGEPGTLMILEPLSDSEFEMTYTTGGEVVACTLDHSLLTYSCLPAESIDETPSSYGLNAVILVTLESEGTFTSEADMSLRSVVELDCDGADCFWVEQLMGTSLPCEMSMQSEVTAG